MKSSPILALLLGAAALAEPARPLAIAHRGASGYLPEHTIAAKAYAHALGADYIEQDLVLSKDHVPVVLHDIHLDTTTDVARRFPDRKRADGRYYALDLTVAEMKELRVSERFNAKSGQPVYPRRFPLGKSSFRISTFEEELQLIQGLNAATGRRAGIYPELKQPAWHQAQGADIARVVLPILIRHGYATKSDPCFLQCFELTTVRRLREELGWQGRLVMLIGGGRKGDDGTDYDGLCTAEGLGAVAKIADGIGPTIARLVTWAPGVSVPKFTSLAKLAQAERLALHPYTVRADDLPKDCPSLDALHAALFRDLRVEGVFTDFPDQTAAWLRAHGMR